MSFFIISKIRSSFDALLQKVTNDIMEKIEVELGKEETFLIVDKELKEVSGMVMILNETDNQDEIIKSLEQIRKSMINFMIGKGKILNINHKGLNDKLVITQIFFNDDENLIYKSFQIPRGWFMTIRILDNKVWEKVLDGKLRGFSWAGKARKVY